VDDEPDNLYLAKEVLTLYGAEVVEAASGPHALDSAQDFSPNLILLDLAMPGMDGWEVHQQLRARPEHDHAPIIALTALAMTDDADRVAEAGFDGYITKPFFVRSLIQQIAECIDAFRRSR
jgi:CheY-like chemotaxis protein